VVFAAIEWLRGWLMPPPFWLGGLGAKGEYLARRHYHRRGYHCLDRNWRLGRGEIDLIMANARRVVFVEVKARAWREDLRIGDQLRHAQAQRLARLARARLRAWGGEVPWRFDLALLQFRRGRCVSVQIARLI